MKVKSQGDFELIYSKGIPQFLIPNLKGANGSFYFAYSTARVSLTTLTFI